MACATWVRFSELVPMIHDWVQRSFLPQQEERLERKGRLCARFKVQLGQKMAEHLQAYVRASFALKLLQVRVRLEESTARNRPPQEFVEIIMTPEARALYAEKNPEAAEKYRQQLVPAADAEGGLIDDEDEEAAAQLALEDARLAIQDEPGARQDQGRAVKRRRGEAPEPTKVSAAPAPAAKGKEPVAPAAPASGAAKRAPLSAPPPPPAPGASATAPAAGCGSVWEQCPAYNVVPGSAGLAEARDTLSDNLARKARGGMDAIRAEREAVAWLKGLQQCDVEAADLAATRIGVVVNEWRKHQEPYIAGLATSLLAAWKRSWRQAGGPKLRAALEDGPAR